MEGFFHYMAKKYFVDYDNQDVKDMTKSVQDCLEDFTTEFNNNEECGVKIDKILLCGSMAEETSIWLGKHNYQMWTEEKDSIKKPFPYPSFPRHFSCIEFDILAILKPITSDMTTVSTCAGHAMVTSSMYPDGLTINDLRKVKKDDYENDEVLNLLEKPYKVINSEFREGIISTVEKRLKGVQADFKMETNTGICTLEFLHSYDEANPLFLWINTNNQNQDNTIFGKIDFLPAFKTTHISDPTYIVAKPCNRSYFPNCSTGSTCDSNCDEQCWRVSRGNKETARIRSTAEHHRNLYRIIKVFADKASRHVYLSRNLFDKNVSDSFVSPTSYHTKTVLLHHIKDCVSFDILKCLCELLLKSKEFTHSGKILNWECTYALNVDIYEIYFYFILWMIFSHGEHESPLDFKECSFELPEVIKDKTSVLLSDFSKGKVRYEDLEKGLESILVFPLWDYAMGITQLNTEIFKNDRCDFELEKRSNVYACNGVETRRIQAEVKPVLRRSHSENDLYILADYFDRKNFDKNWESIFWCLKSNSIPDESLTQHIKTMRQQTNVSIFPEEDIFSYGYDSAEKEMIASVIKEDEDYWYDQLMESFILFSNTVEI